MKTTVVCGLLGAGKTTFIQNFVRDASEKTVVLVNDFGKAGIDGDIISAGGLETIELPSGCVCCTLKFDLITTLQKIMKDLSPGRLLIEPSGVAAVSGILEALEHVSLMPVTVVGILDATEFTELYESGMFGSFFEDQIRNSDILLVNKADLAGESLVEQTAETAGRLNPGALLVKTTHARLEIPLPEGSEKKTVKSGPDFHFNFDTLSFPLKEGTAVEALERLFCEMGEGFHGEVVRAKALLQTDRGPYRFDLSYGKVDSIPFGAPVEKGRLVVIGEKLQRESIARRLGVKDLLHPS